MIMKCPLGIYFRGNYVLRCFTVLLRYIIVNQRTLGWKPRQTSNEYSIILL